jgi:hypothetical protein
MFEFECNYKTYMSAIWTVTSMFFFLNNATVVSFASTHSQIGFVPWHQLWYSCLLHRGHSWGRTACPHPLQISTISKITIQQLSWFKIVYSIRKLGRYNLFLFLLILLASDLVWHYRKVICIVVGLFGVNSLTYFSSWEIELSCFWRFEMTITEFPLCI